MKYDDGRPPLPPAGVHVQPWAGISQTARRLGRARTALYRFFAADGRLLYVGITIDLVTRWEAHAKDAPWWHLQASYTVVYFAHRAEAETAERHAIRTEKPLYNTVHAEPGTGRKGALARPERRPARPREVAAPAEPWIPTPEQRIALDQVAAAAAIVDDRGKGALPLLHDAIRKAWALAVPGAIVAAHTKKGARK